MYQRLEGILVLRIGEPARAMKTHEVAKHRIASGERPARFDVVGRHESSGPAGPQL